MEHSALAAHEAKPGRTTRDAGACPDCLDPAACEADHRCYSPHAPAVPPEFAVPAPAVQPLTAEERADLRDWADGWDGVHPLARPILRYEATLAAAERRAEEAERRLAMPGQWTCDVCGYGESRAVISAINGAAKANPLADDPRCPNDHEPLRPLRWDEAGREARALSRELADRLAASEAALAEARQALDEAESRVSMLTSMYDLSHPENRPHRDIPLARAAVQDGGR